MPRSMFCVNNKSNRHILVFVLKDRVDREIVTLTLKSVSIC